MSLPFLDNEPASFVAGETVKWKRSFPDFPASVWSLSYAFVKDGKLIALTAGADGDDFAITISSTVSATYEAGVYSYQATVSDGTERQVVGLGKITIKPGFAAVGAGGYDNRSLAKKMVDTLETLFPVIAAKRFASYTVGGQSGTFKTLAELQAAYDRWKAIYYREERRAGRKSSRTIRAGLQ